MTNLIPIMALTKKETSRVFRIWKQTIVPPVVTWILYFLIFWVFIWGQMKEINWVPYINFIVPWFILMSVITASYSNVSSSFFGSKFNKSIEELIVSPIKKSHIIIAYTLWWIIRWVMVWLLIFVVASFFTNIDVTHPLLALLFLFLTSALFSLAWLFNAFFAKTFDDVTIIPNFVITPLIYLWGVFYPLSFLPDFWQIVTQFNPILYLINWFRYSLLNYSEVTVLYSAVASSIFVIVLFILNVRLMEKWYGIKS